ncbi:MAG: hypothetical protein Q9226_007661 [Calogaya cf. arnoldii]
MAALPPVTPEKQRADSRLSQKSTITDELNDTPEFSPKLSPLKRTFSQTSTDPTPQLASAFIHWRLQCIDEQLHFFQTAKEAVIANKKEGQFMTRVTKELKNLESEKIILTSQKRFIIQDLEDATQATTDAYIAELEYAFANASSHGAKPLKQPRLERKPFKQAVATYLDSKKPHTMHDMLFCQVLGQYLPSAGPPGVTCAHIVPFSFENKQLQYMFGAEEAALTRPRNGMFLFEPIEKAFDNGWIAVVPNGSIEQNPTEWKVVVLQDDLLDKVVYEDPYTDKETKWSDLHNRKLAWKNENRPARRYLYMRYALTWLAARRAAYPGWQAKLPSGTMWASPGKPGGYLRNSILRVLASRIGDTTPLPQDMILSGGFDDPDSQSKVQDQVAALTLPILVRDHLDGKLVDQKDDDDEEEEEDEAISAEMLALTPGL